MRQLLIFSTILLIQSLSFASWVPSKPGYCPVPEKVFAYNDLIVFNELGVFYQPEGEIETPFMMVEGTLTTLLFGGEEETQITVLFNQLRDGEVEATITVDGTAFEAQCHYGSPLN